MNNGYLHNVRGLTTVILFATLAIQKVKINLQSNHANYQYTDVALPIFGHQPIVITHASEPHSIRPSRQLPGDSVTNRALNSIDPPPSSHVYNLIVPQSSSGLIATNLFQTKFLIERMILVTDIA